MATYYRIEKRRHQADAFAGIGGPFSAGRWHRRGVRVAYVSEHPAVAVLEKRAWLSSLSEALAENAVVISVEVPEEVVEVLDPAALPGDWASFPHLPETREIGTRWLLDRRSVALRVPSAVVPSASNLLLNPLHPGMAGLVVGEPEPFRWDPRLFGPSASRG